MLAPLDSALNPHTSPNMKLEVLDVKDLTISSAGQAALRALERALEKAW